MATTSRRVIAHSNGPEESRLWFSTRPLSTMDIRKMTCIQLITDSKDQGFVSQSERGSWSYFDIAIAHVLSPSPYDEGQEEPDAPIQGRSILEIKTEPDGSLCKYRSHNNHLASRGYSAHHGVEMGPDHEIWEHLAPGDILSVYACAIYPGWLCDGIAATLQVRSRFEPIFITRG